MNDAVTPRARGGWALGLAGAAAAAPFVYVVARVVEWRLSPESDPAAVIWAEHSAMQLRLMVAGYATAVLAGGTVALAVWRPAWAARMVTALAVLSTLAMLAMLALWP